MFSSRTVNLKYGTDDPILKKKKTTQIMAKESRLGVPKGERGGSGMDGHFGGGGWMQTVIF